MTVGEGIDTGENGRAAPSARLGALGRRWRTPASLSVAAGVRAGRFATIASDWQAEIDNRRLFLFVPVLLGAGAALWFSLAPPGTAVLLLALIAAGGPSGLASRRGGLARLASMSVALILAGMLLADMETRRRATVVLDAPVTTVISGTVETRELGPTGDWRYVVAINATREPALGRPPRRVTLVARTRHEALEIGAAVEGRARLSPPSGPALPGLNDFAFQAYFRGIGAVGYFLGPPLPGRAEAVTDIGGDGLVVTVERFLQRFRGGISDRIRAVVPGDAGAFAAAIVTGDRRAMSEEAVEALRVSGLAHVISISGLHMALASGLFFVGVRVLLSLSVRMAHGLPTKKIAAVGALCAATAYLLISGGEVAAVRAYLMMAVMLVAVLVDRPAISMRNLALAALVIVIVWPSQVMGPSFQMSFAATAALIAGYAVVRRRSREDGLLPVGWAPPLLAAAGRLLGGILLSSVIGGLATALFAIEHFHRVGLYSLPANLMAMPLVSFIVMPAGLAAMILMPFGLDYYPLKIMGLGLDVVIAMAEEVARWGGHGGVERLPAWFLPVAVTGFVILLLLKSRLRHIGTLLLGLALAALAVLPRPPAGALLVSEDGTLVAQVRGDGLASNRLRPPSFIFDQWKEALQRTEHHKPNVVPDPALQAFAEARLSEASPAILARVTELMDLGLSLMPPGRFHCIANAFCLARLDGGAVVASVEEPAFVGPACDRADLVVTARRLSFRTCRSGAALISAADLRLTGVLEITPLDRRHFHVRAAMPDTPRPWHMHRRYDWRRRVLDQTPLAEVLARISGNAG